MITGKIISIKNFEIHDGDGVRTTVFMKGCPLACKWCHNPESISGATQLGYYEHKCVSCGNCASVCKKSAHEIKDGNHVFDRTKCALCGACVNVCAAKALVMFGKETDAETLADELCLDKLFFDKTGGGVTVSGGEPLFQADFVAELLKILKSRGINTAVDTCLYAEESELKKVLPYTDTFLVDVKAMDAEVHKKLTGKSNERILSNFAYLANAGVRIEVRVPFVPNCNDGEMDKISDFLSGFDKLVGVKILPYHDYAADKYGALGYNYRASDARVPTKEETELVRASFEKKGLRVIRD